MLPRVENNLKIISNVLSGVDNNLKIISNVLSQVDSNIKLLDMCYLNQIGPPQGICNMLPGVDSNSNHKIIEICYPG